MRELKAKAKKARDDIAIDGLAINVKQPMMMMMMMLTSEDTQES